MVKRIGALILIYACTVAAWVLLGGSVTARTNMQDTKLRTAVGRLWGSPQIQEAPSVYYLTTQQKKVERFAGGEKIVETATETTMHRLPLEGSNIGVDLKLEHRQKGLLWYSTYSVNFNGRYRIINSTDKQQEIHFDFGMPVRNATYDNFKLVVGGKEQEPRSSDNGSIAVMANLGPGQTEDIELSYQTQGLDVWKYFAGMGVSQIKNFSLTVTTDFKDIDFPQDGSSPTTKQESATGWKLEWKYTNLLSGNPIGVVMPQKLNPGPWVSRVCFTAPVSLFLFFFLTFVLTTLKKVHVHPMNYFFVAAAFFSFHLLLAYLVDHLDINISFLISSTVSIFLVISYMRLVVGSHFAFLEIGISQFVYLIVFSYTFFFEGFTGLAVTILCIITLFTVMQLTGRMNWEEVFKKNP